MRPWQLAIAVVVLLVVGVLVMALCAPLSAPSVELVLEARFQAAGKWRALKVRGSDVAVAVDPGTQVRFAVYPKSEPTGQLRKVGQTVEWESDWEGGPRGPGRHEVSFSAPRRPGTRCLRHMLRVDYRNSGRWRGRWRAACTVKRARLFLLVPVSGRELRGGRIRGYAVGQYPPGAEPPREVVEVTADCHGALVSPNYRLDVFASPGETYPKYAPLNYALVDKLEALTSALHAQGRLEGPLNVYSVYRTPLRNTEVHGASRSQHLWGRAADLTVDADPRDGQMDDLDGDGRVSIRDAMVVGAIARRLEREGAVARGGTGVYQQADESGGVDANVHIDVRGRQAKWARHYPTPGDMEHWDNVRWDG